MTDRTDEKPECSEHPDAPHGFDRNASHSADRYVCECESWEPVDAVNMSEERVHKSDKQIMFKRLESYEFAINEYEQSLKAAFPQGATGDAFYHWNNARKHGGRPYLSYEVPTLDVQSTMEMWKRAYEAVCDERDAIVKDADKAYELLRWAETEMRYAGWDVRINDQQGRTDVYESIVEFLK